jgi:hypothetical protein
MHARERMIRARLTSQPCRHCGELYPADGVLVLARRPQAWMVLASCPSCQRRCIFVVSFHETQQRADVQPAEDSRFFPDAFLPREPVEPFPTEDLSSPSPDSPDPKPERPLVPVTVSDVSEMAAFLSHFNGDFRSLFSFPQAPRPDEPPTG